MKTPIILVVDDAFFMRRLLGDIIKEAGYTEVLFAEDGFQAIDAANSMKPDIVTLDISMPGMDGLEVIGKLLSVSPLSKIIMVSAVTGQTIMNEAIKNGAVDFLKKPFDKGEVKEMLKKYIQ
jgi:two-component system, chemotaxis family, chemotaxis protein CheY